jgi:hypothetical protein
MDIDFSEAEMSNTDVQEEGTIESGVLLQRVLNSLLATSTPTRSLMLQRLLLASSMDLKQQHFVFADISFPQ